MKSLRLSPLSVHVALALGAWAAQGASSAWAQATPPAPPPAPAAPTTPATPAAPAVPAAASPAAAPAPAPTPAAPAAADSGQIQNITITANRRAEDAQKVSVSVTAVNAQTLAERNVTDLSQMESLSAGFTFGRSGVDARPAIRGVRTENVAVNADTTIGFFVDGVYKSRAQQAMLGFIDLARVEIQRGPQGTLFGRNTFGGNVAITTNAPELKTFEANASLGAGSFGLYRAEGAVNVPLGEIAAFRVAGAVEQAKPWVKNDFNANAGLFDRDLKFLRASFKLQPTRELEAVLRADVTRQSALGGSAFGYKLVGTYLDTASCQQLFNSTLVTNLNTRGGNRDGVNDCTRTVGAGAGTGANAAGTSVDLGVPIYRPGDFSRINNDYQSFLQTRDTNLSADVSYRMRGFTLKSITGFADFSAERSQDSDFSSSTIAIDYQKTSAKTFSQEFQILSERSDPFGYVAGVYLFKDKLTGLFINQQLPRTIRSDALTAPLTLPQNGGGFYDLQRPETDSKAVYGQVNYKVLPTTTVTAGARYTRDTKSFKFANANSVLPLTPAGAPDGTQITLGTPLPPDSAFGSAGATNCTGTNAQPGFNCLPTTNTVTGATYSDATFSKATGKVALDHQLNKDQLVYATVSTGFRSGGFNSGQALEVLRTFKPEEVKAFEVGSKNRFLGNTLQLNMAVFANRYTNLQEQRQVPVGNTTVSVIFNAAKAKANGFEAEMEWRQSKTFSLGGSLSLLDAKYTQFPDVALPFGTSILVADPTSTAPQTDANGVVIAPAGQRRVFAPGYNCGVVPGTGGTGQPAAAFGCDLSGKRLPYAPTLQSSVFARNDFMLPGGSVLTPIFVVTYSSGFYGQPTNAQIERQGKYVKADIKLNWRINNQYSLLGFVDNVTNKQTLNRFVWGGGGALQGSAASPRTFGLKMSYALY
jgi:iron complex outermembrane recepter protein